MKGHPGFAKNPIYIMLACLVFLSLFMHPSSGQPQESSEACLSSEPELLAFRTPLVTGCREVHPGVCEGMCNTGRCASQYNPKTDRYYCGCANASSCIQTGPIACEGRCGAITTKKCVLIEQRYYFICGCK
jgi:hypothetical protein